LVSKYIDEHGCENWKTGIKVQSTFVKIQKIEDVRRPNCFYYACPADMIQSEEVPSYAGLIYITSGKVPVVVKKAPFIDKIKRNYDRILLDKFYYRHLQKQFTT
jgi:hypothetical protein